MERDEEDKIRATARYGPAAKKVYAVLISRDKLKKFIRWMRSKL